MVTADGYSYKPGLAAAAAGAAPPSFQFQQQHQHHHPLPLHGDGGGDHDKVRYGPPLLPLALCPAAPAVSSAPHHSATPFIFSCHSMHPSVVLAPPPSPTV
jgi:hypothetical protein